MSEAAASEAHVGAELPVAPLGPLADVRVVSLEQYGAGPFGSLPLADLGAQVIKIEDPASGGDVGRYVPPFAEGEDSLFFETFNRNKLSVELDLSCAAGRLAFEALVKRSDVVYSNLRGDVPERLGIRYSDLCHVNPAVVCCSLSGFGMTGPRRSEPGYDYILQGLTGWMDLTGEPEGPPTKSGLSLVDYSGGLVAAVSILAALHAARRSGVGSDCDVSLFDTAIMMLSYPATWFLTAGHTTARTPHSSHPSLVPFQNFQTSDGWIVIGAAKEKFWRRLVEALDLPELADDPRFSSFAKRAENREVLLDLLQKRLLEQTTASWLAKLGPAGVPSAPVNSLAQALAEEHVEARAMIAETEHHRFGRVRAPASAVRVGPPGADRPQYRRAPKRGEHTWQVLSEIAELSEREIEDLARQGAFGDRRPRPPGSQA